MCLHIVYSVDGALAFLITDRSGVPIVKGIYLYSF